MAGFINQVSSNQPRNEEHISPLQLAIDGD
jgi:hypothetical protein